jgi:DNA-binding HxlR family transcriptional regulator
MTNAKNLIPLLHSRWAMPVLAVLARDGGGRLVALQRGLRAPRESIRAVLALLTREGFITRNTGHGHPVRPEYIVSPAAARIAAACLQVEREFLAVGAADAAAALGRAKWPLPVLLAVHDGAARFSAMERALPGVTPRSLTLALKALETAGMLSRSVVPGHPPHTVYAAAPASGGLVAAAGELAAALGAWSAREAARGAGT